MALNNALCSDGPPVARPAGERGRLAGFTQGPVQPLPLEVITNKGHRTADKRICDTEPIKVTHP
jgi:hypothetical protein